jgi:hypothetical protein
VRVRTCVYVLACAHEILAVNLQPVLHDDGPVSADHDVPSRGDPARGHEPGKGVSQACWPGPLPRGR